MKELLAQRILGQKHGKSKQHPKSGPNLLNPNQRIDKSMNQQSNHTTERTQT